MKLYTEEQVRQAIWEFGDLLFNNCQDGIKEDDIDTYLDIAIEDVTPIELPSDKEIGKQAFQVPYDGTNEFYDKSFIKGAKWIKEQILNQNK